MRQLKVRRIVKREAIRAEPLPIDPRNADVVRAKRRIYEREVRSTPRDGQPRALTRSENAALTAHGPRSISSIREAMSARRVQPPGCRRTTAGEWEYFLLSSSLRNTWRNNARTVRGIERSQRYSIRRPQRADLGSSRPYKAKVGGSSPSAPAALHEWTVADGALAWRRSPASTVRARPFHGSTTGFAVRHVPTQRELVTDTVRFAVHSATKLSLTGAHPSQRR
jgi:hypothetical protein